MAELTVLFDGGCPLCLREVNTLQRLDNGRQRLAFVDIDQPDYNPSLHQGISYRQAMGRIHAIAADGEIVTDVAVFRRAYGLERDVRCTGSGFIRAGERLRKC